MKLLVDGRAFSTISAGRGIGRYTRSMVEALAALSVDVTVLASADAELPPGVNRHEVRRVAPRGFHFLEQAVRTPRDIADAAPDVFWSTTNDPPHRSPVPWVQTFYDVIPRTITHRRTAYARNVWRARGRWMRKANRVVAISQFSAGEAMRWFGIPASRLLVVYPGVDGMFRPPERRAEPDDPFVLLVAGYGAHKGYTTAFDVLDGLAARGLPHRLKIAGGMGRGARLAIDRGASRHGDRVEILGFVADDELVQLYQSASLLIVTSQSEGFCLPAVEAMASGLPVVAFANSAIPESVGDAGVLVADGDVAAFAAACAELLTDAGAWRGRAEAGLGNARRFSWVAAAAAYDEVFRELTP